MSSAQATRSRSRSRFSLPTARRPWRAVGDEYHYAERGLVVRAEEPRPARWTAKTSGSQVGDPSWRWGIYRNGKWIASTTAGPLGTLTMAEGLERTRLANTLQVAEQEVARLKRLQAQVSTDRRTRPLPLGGGR